MTDSSTVLTDNETTLALPAENLGQPSNQYVADMLGEASCLSIALHHCIEDIHSLGAARYLLRKLDTKIDGLYELFHELAEQDNTGEVQS